MTDVKPEIAKLQCDMFMALPTEQHFLIGLKMCEEGMKLLVSSVRNEFPDADEAEFQVQMLRRLKRHNPEKLAWINV